MAVKIPILSRRSVLLGGGSATLTALAAGCSDDGGTGAAQTSTGAGSDDLSDVIYENGATDEALIALRSLVATSDATQGTSFTWPSEGEKLVAANPAAFWWAVGIGRVDSPGFLERAVGAVLGVKPAYAHGMPISGRAYFLVFSTAKNAELLRVFTTALTYTSTADV